VPTVRFHYRTGRVILDAIF